MSNLNLQKLCEWVWPWPWTFSNGAVVQNADISPLRSATLNLSPPSLASVVLRISHFAEDRRLSWREHATRSQIAHKVKRVRWSSPWLLSATYLPYLFPTEGRRLSWPCVSCVVEAVEWPRSGTLRIRWIVVGSQSASGSPTSRSRTFAGFSATISMTSSRCSRCHLVTNSSSSSRSWNKHLFINCFVLCKNVFYNIIL